jgi:hypothetical protein
MAALVAVVFAPACFARTGAATLVRRPALGAAAAGRVDLVGTAAMHLRGGAALGDGLTGDAGAVPGLRKRARRLAKAGDWGGAADAYAEAVTLLTGEPSAAAGAPEAVAGDAEAGDAAALQSCLLNRALCCLKAERLEDAVAVCTAALKAEPSCGMAHYRRGQATTPATTPATRPATTLAPALAIALAPAPAPALALALALALAPAPAPALGRALALSVVCCGRVQALLAQGRGAAAEWDLQRSAKLLPESKEVA